MTDAGALTNCVLHSHSDGNDAKRIWRLARFQIAVILSFDSPYSRHVKQYEHLYIYIQIIYQNEILLMFLSSFSNFFRSLFLFFVPGLW